MMSKEGEKWQQEFRRKIDAFEEAKKRTEQDLDPLRATLRDLENEVMEQTEKIRGVKKNISDNDMRIKAMLRSVATN
jgi:peptidoglycan hydrolase CwlO-like protein